MNCGCFAQDRHNVCFKAALKGHLACLKYAHEKGFPWSARTCAAAAKNGHLGCLQYAHENGCPWDKTTGLAATSTELAAIRWRCKGRKVSKMLCAIYAFENGCPHNTYYLPGDLEEQLRKRKRRRVLLLLSPILRQIGKSRSLRFPTVKK